MNISALTNVTSDYIKAAETNTKNDSSSVNSFDGALKTAMNLVQQTNDYQNQAESAEIQFALGDATNTHDLQVAQQKANVALQFTVAVRDKAMDAYKEIMNMSI